MAAAIKKALPTAITLCALASGLTAMRLYGHVARALQAASAFGAEMDSLCDLVDFGVSPAIVVYLWCSQNSTPSDAWWASDAFLWACCLFYAGCCACRLARFNLSNEVPAPQPPHSTHFVEELDSDSEDGAQAKDKAGLRRRKTPRASLMEEVPAEETAKPDKKWLDDYVNRTKFFQGVPAPAGAYLAILPMAYTFQYGKLDVAGLPVQTVISAMFVAIGCLMVMTARTFSSKMLIKGPVRAKDPHTSHLRSRSFWTFLLKCAFAAGVIYVFLLAPWRFFLVCGLVYVISLPVGPLTYNLLLTDHHL